MRRAAVPVLAWASFLTVLAVVLWLWTPDDLPPAIFSAAAGVAWLVGLFAFLRAQAPPPVRVTPDLSPAGVMVAIAVAMLVIGALVGEWLILIGAGALLGGLAGVGRELYLQRRVR